MKSTFPRIALTAAAALAAIALTTGAASADGPVELKFATSAPAGSPWQKQFDRLASDVAEQTGGSVKINVFYSSQLGAENDAIAQLARGRIETGAFTVGSISLQVPAANLPALYMYYESDAQRDCILDKHLADPFRALVASKGLHFLGWMEVGQGHLTGKKAYVTPADIKGVKVGTTTNKMVNEFWEVYGAIPVATPIPEAAANMSTGLIDIYPTVAAFYVPSGLNKVAPVYTKVPYSQGPAALLMSKSVYDKLTPTQREGITKAVAKVPATQLRREIDSLGEALLAKHKEGGGQIVELTAAQRAEWRKPMPAFWSKVAKDLGKEGEAFFAKMEAAKKACGS